MDKGIRVSTNAKFVELLPKRAEMGNTAFRKAVIMWAVEEFDITVASACTHYNHAFKVAKAATPELVEGLGRPEDKKGGRKSNASKAAAAAAAFVDAEGADQVTYNVCKKADGSVVAEDLSFEDAQAMVTAGRVKGRFCKLYWI